LRNGTGSVDDAANWSCTANSNLLQVGPNGRQAGVGQQNDVFDAD